MTKAKRHPRGNDYLHSAVTDFSTLDPCQEDTCFLKKITQLLRRSGVQTLGRSSKLIPPPTTAKKNGEGHGVGEWNPTFAFVVQDEMLLVKLWQHKKSMTSSLFLRKSENNVK